MTWLENGELKKAQGVIPVVDGDSFLKIIGNIRVSTSANGPLKNFGKQTGIARVTAAKPVILNKIRFVRLRKRLVQRLTVETIIQNKLVKPKRLQ